MADIVYILCFATGAVAALVLLGAWARTRIRILLWTGFGFDGLSLNNLMLIVDFVFVPQTDHSLVRTMPAVLGMSLMLFGPIWQRD